MTFWQFCDNHPGLSATLAIIAMLVAETAFTNFLNVWSRRK